MKAADSLYRNMHAFKNICIHTFAVHSSLFSLNLTLKSIHVPPGFNRFLVNIQEILPNQDFLETLAWDFGSSSAVCGSHSAQVYFLIFPSTFCSMSQRTFSRVTVLFSSTVCLKKDREPRAIQRKEMVYDTMPQGHGTVYDSRGIF